MYIKNENTTNIKEQDPVVIGQLVMPINLLLQAKDEKDVCFDGRAKIFLKKNISIGYLKLKMQFSKLPEDSLFENKSKTFPYKLTENDDVKLTFY